MGMAMIALFVYILWIMFWSVKINRSIVEGMIAGYVLVGCFGGSNMFKYLYNGLLVAIRNEVVFAAMAFLLMSYLMKESKLFDGILEVLNAIFGRISGGPAYINIAISAFMGMLSGSNSANSATSGSFTAQWMIQTGWKKEVAATLIAGNGGLGAGLPPSASMFIMLGFSYISSMITESQLYVGLFVSAVYQIIWRIILVQILVKKNKIKADHSEITSGLANALKKNWQSFLVFLVAIIPIVITMSPLGTVLRSFGLSEGMGKISLLVWIPISMILITLVVGYKTLKQTLFNRKKWMSELLPLYQNIGGLLIFAFAASEIFTFLGLSSEVTAILDQIVLPKTIAVTLVALLVVLVAGPLSSTATLTSIGLISFQALISVGVPPLAAVVSILVFASTEGASPPASGSIFIASGLTGAAPESTFLPLIKYFVVPVMVIGWLIAMGILPLFV